MRKNIFLLLLSVFLFHTSFAQRDSCNLTISLITCGPGEDLYSLFGHSALRVRDRVSGEDIAYNYGTFDFDDDFYYNFVKGRLLYNVSPEYFIDFMYGYRIENRSVVEQVLNLNCETKYRLNAALQNNIREENKYYLYQFFFDNCSTRLRNIVYNNSQDSVSFHTILPNPSPTFRNLIHEYLNRGQQYWSKLGIDLLLGSRIDSQATSNEAMFLPDYLSKGFDSATLGNGRLVGSKKLVLPSATETSGPRSFITPLVVSSILLLILGPLSMSRSQRIRRFLHIADLPVFFIIGCMGLLILIMWFGTEHDLCADNYNLLWALPTHLPVTLFMLSKRKWVASYFAVSACIYLLVLTAWPFLPQGMNSAFIPLVVLAGIRSLARATQK